MSFARDDPECYRQICFRTTKTLAAGASASVSPINALCRTQSPDRWIGSRRNRGRERVRAFSSATGSSSAYFVTYHEKTKWTPILHLCVQKAVLPETPHFLCVFVVAVWVCTDPLSHHSFRAHVTAAAVARLHKLDFANSSCLYNTGPLFSEKLYLG